MFGRKFVVVALSSLACWTIKLPFSLPYFISLPSFLLIPNFRNYQLGKYCTDCFSVTVSLVVTARRVGMDTSFPTDCHSWLYKF